MNRAKLVFSVTGLLVSLFLTTRAFAENNSFIKEYTYTASDIDSKVSSRAIALDQVKRRLLDQLGAYLITETGAKNFQLTKDQITTLLAGIVSVEVIHDKWDGETYYLKAKITANPQDVVKPLDVLRNDVQKTRELEGSRNIAEEAMRKIDRLRKESKLAKENGQIKLEYANAIKDLLAADWFDKGLAFYMSHDLNSAINAYNNAIELYPKYALAYFSRGDAYTRMGSHQQAIMDYNC